MEIAERITQLQKQISDGIAARDFGNTPGEKLLLDYINERVSALINKMVAATPLDDRTYLEMHGRVNELQMINTMLQSKASSIARAEEELNVIRPDTSTESA